MLPGQAGHDLIEESAFIMPGTRKQGGLPRAGCEGYDLNQAPCICAEGPDNTTASHGLLHTFQGMRAKKRAPSGKWKFKEASATGAAAVNLVFKNPCSEKCLEAQLAAYHQSCGIDPEKDIVASPSGKLNDEKVEAAWKEYDEKFTNTNNTISEMADEVS